MDDAKQDAGPRRGKLRTLTVTALLGLFVVAVLAALAGRLVGHRRDHHDAGEADGR